MPVKRKKPLDVNQDTDTRQRIRMGVEREAPPKNPLSKEHLHALNQVIDECRQTAEMCSICIDAGIDVEPERLVNAEQLAMAEKLRAAFFPRAS